ncbi:glycoside hydrolase family 36 protein [Bacillus sp. FSL K6-3431]|uniref:glycoside hydrolase family 36 protein n=1 Tax=Bacillus sp. FSL K6-3431 TaxID=2921500 RepID=UPI0030F78F4E
MYTIDLLKKADSEVRVTESLDHEIQLTRKWDDNTCVSTLENRGNQPVKVKEVVLFKGNYDSESIQQVYGEGYSMLSQYIGELSSLKSISKFSDQDHYKIPQVKGFQTVYNLAVLTMNNGDQILLGFSSCHRFNGEIRFGNREFEIVLDLEGLSMGSGQLWELEEFVIAIGNNREEVMDQLAGRIQINHPKLEVNEVPTGWCSWYSFGPNVMEKDIFANMESIAKEILDLKYIQIDDGYQPYMGDWLIPSARFSSNIQSLCKVIREKGFEPAIWVAPFIAEENSELFKEHPNWFVTDEDGHPLLSSKVSFGGWRRGPWYMLDGTHPEAQQYLYEVFRTMQEDWGCHYFKLDANMWGAMHGGFFHDSGATRVEAYRRGMQAVLEGAGKNGFLLGCNAPMWPSLGIVHGMRVTGDISRKWSAISDLAKECFYRNWQHKRLWVNDPDCIVLENSKTKLIGPDGKDSIKNISNVSDNEFLFHATYIVASGGMVLSGDNIVNMTDESIKILKKCLLPTNAPAHFESDAFRIGRMDLNGYSLVCLFNWENNASTFEVDLQGKCEIVDYWTDENLGIHERKFRIENMEPHSASLLKVTNISNHNLLI